MVPLAEHPNVWAETSFVESGNTLADAVARMGADRVVFGSHSPLFYLEPAAIKLNTGPAEVDPPHIGAVRSDNAQALLSNS